MKYNISLFPTGSNSNDRREMIRNCQFVSIKFFNFATIGVRSLRITIKYNRFLKDSSIYSSVQKKWIFLLIKFDYELFNIGSLTPKAINLFSSFISIFVIERFYKVTFAFFAIFLDLRIALKLEIQYIAVSYWL